MQTIDTCDPESCYRAVKSRDRRFDGVFYCAVRTTGIYCRPSCPARTPAFHNVTFHPSPASAQAAGYRACKRCLPDATPGSPDWDVAATAAGRAMRLIADGVVDREGVEGLARRVGYTPRHLTRLLTAELGAGPLALARARRAQTARVLIETTELAYADVAFAAGFSSVRQFNETVREVYAATPDRPARPSRRPGAAGRGDHAAGRAHAVRRHARCSTSWPSAPCRASRPPGRAGTRARSRSRTGGHGAARHTRCAEAGADGVRHARRCRSRTCATPTAATERARRLLDADCDPLAVDDVFAGDPVHRAAGPAPPRPAGAGPRRRRRDRGARGARPAGQRRRRAHRRRRGSSRARPSGGPAREGLTHLFPDAATARRRSTRRRCRCRGRVDGRWSRSARRWPRRRGARPRPRPRRRTRAAARRCPASGRGPPTTSRCALSATPTSSCPPTSASAHALAGLGHDRLAAERPSAGDRGAPTR